ncbi:MAG: DUF1499 domain-containing protein [Pseudomonadota bacterium]
MRWIIIFLGLGALLAAVGYVWVSQMPLNDAKYDVDPTEIERTGRPNDYLVAPEGMTNATPDRASKIFAEAPEDLLARFVEIARAQPRVRPIGGTPLFQTFEQRTQLVGFRDYISVKAVQAVGGSALIVYSRSTVGYSDWGVNKARVEDWLSKL